MSFVSSVNQSFSLAQSSTRKAAAMELLNSINSPGSRQFSSNISQRKESILPGRPKTNEYQKQTYRINLMLPTALLLKQYDPKINAVRFSLNIKKFNDELVWQSAEDSQISQLDYLEQEIEHQVDDLLRLLKDDGIKQDLIQQCKHQIQQGPARLPEFQYKTAQQARLEQQERNMNEQLQRQAILTADVKPFNAANVQKKELVVEQPTFKPQKFNSIEPKNYQGPYVARQTAIPPPDKAEEFDFRPQICKKSEEMAKKGKFSSVEDPVEYEKQRLSAMKQRKEDKQAEAQKEATYKPQITKFAEQMEFDIKDVFERQEKKRIEAEGKLLLMKNASANKETEGLTFCPQISDYKGRQRRQRDDHAFREKDTQEYVQQKQMQQEREMKECTFQPKINQNSKKLAEHYESTVREREIKEQLAKSQQQKPRRSEEEVEQFYSQLYQKGQDLLTYKKAFEEFAESTNVILASSVHTNPRSYQMARKSHLRECEKIFDELSQQGVLISRKIETYAKKMKDLKLAARLREMAAEKEVWVHDEFIEYLADNE